MAEAEYSEKSVFASERRILWKKQGGEANQIYNSVEGERLLRKKNDQLGWSYCKNQVLLWAGEYVWPEPNKCNIGIMDMENLELHTDNTYHKYILFFT